MSETGKLLISDSPDATLVEGVVGASSDLMAIVGTVKEASAPVIDDVKDLERAIVEAAQSGSKVMDGYIKFAHPITIKKARHIGEVKEAADRVATLDDCGLMGFIGKLATLESLDDADGIEKLAAHPFVDNMINQIELDKVDGKEVGIRAPVKVAFRDDKVKEWFLNLFDKKAQEEKKAAHNLAERLVERGVKAAELADLLSKKMEKTSRKASK